jgi:glycosyltransferase involved in cell wall biosynthesis
MRVLHVYKDYWPVIGGIENHVRVLAEAQHGLGHEVAVLVAGQGVRTSCEVRNGVRIVRAGRLATVASTPISLSLAHHLGRERPHITHLHAPYPIGEASWLLRGRSPMVMTYHSDIVRQRMLGHLWAPLLRRVLARADRIIATSPRYVESSVFLGAVRDRVTVVPLGVDADRFGSAARRGAPRSDGGLDLVFVGRLRYYKGLEVLIDALAALPPTVRLSVVGEGPMGDAWRARSARQGLADRVTWLGDAPDDTVRAELARSDVFVLPATARSEAFGTVLLEAMAAGLPVVSTELGTGTSWVNLDGITGLVVPPNDARALAGAVARLKGDPGERQRMGAAGRDRVREGFTTEHMVAGVLGVYDDIAGPAARAEESGR